MEKLTSKQKRFVSEYTTNNQNATQAAIRAGYSEKTAYSQGQRLLKNVEIQNEIKKCMVEIQQRNDISVDRLLQEEQILAFFDVSRILNADGVPIPLTDLPEDVSRGIASLDINERTDREGNKTITYKYRFWDKGRALERLSKYLGLYSNPIMVNFDEGIKTVLDILPLKIREQVIARLVER